MFFEFLLFNQFIVSRHQLSQTILPPFSLKGWNSKGNSFFTPTLSYMIFWIEVTGILKDMYAKTETNSASYWDRVVKSLWTFFQNTVDFRIWIKLDFIKWKIEINFDSWRFASGAFCKAIFHTKKDFLLIIITK